MKTIYYLLFLSLAMLSCSSKKMLTDLDTGEYETTEYGFLAAFMEAGISFLRQFRT